MSYRTLRYSLAAGLLVSIAMVVPAHSNAQAQSPKELATISSFLDLMHKYYGLIDSVHSVTSSPERAAIIQLYKLQEVYEQGGNKADVEPVLRKVLEDTNNPTIRAATRLMLGELLKETGRSRDAIEVLSQGINESLRNAR